MAAKPVDTGTRVFESQEAADAFSKEMLNRYPRGHTVTRRDAKHLRGLIRRHPDYARKTRGGIDRFKVDTTIHGTKCFHVVRKDGTSEPFSYRKCSARKSAKVRAPARKA